MPTATTFNIQGFSTEDGPGIRTTVFFKGCGLRCAWCHNPEGLRASPDVVWHDVRCIAARECLAACPEDALRLTTEGMQIDRRRCTACGRCADACPAAALEVVGWTWTADELLAEVLKDAVFYETSGGGLTLSGGEPMLQAGFLREFLPACKAAGLHVGLDTCGAVPWEQYQSILPFVDLVLLDLKIMDCDRHCAATGVSNELITANARRISQAGMPMWIRTPVIPGYTDNPDNITAIGRFIRDTLPTVERWDLLAYTNLGRPKYHRLGLPYALEHAKLPTAAEMAAFHALGLAMTPVARWK